MHIIAFPSKLLRRASTLILGGILVAHFIAGTCALAKAEIFVPGIEPIASVDQLEILSDPSGTLSLADSLRDRNFRPIREENLAAPTSRIVWLKFYADFRQYRGASSYLLVDATLVRRIEVFYKDAHGGYVGATVDSTKLMKDRSLAVRGLMVNIAPTTAEVAPIYVRIESQRNSLPVHVKWLSPKGAIEETATDELTQGLIFGGLLLLVVHNIFVMAMARDSAYLLYACYLACFTGLVAIVTGASAKFIQIQDFNTTFVIVNTAVLCSGLGFFRTFLNLGGHARRFDKILQGLQYAAGAITILSLVGQSEISFVASLALIPVSLAAIMASCIVRLRQGFQSAIYSIIGLGVHAGFTTIFVFQLLEFIPEVVVSMRGVETSALWQTLWFSFGLAERIRTKQKKAARDLARRDADLEFSLKNAEVAREEAHKTAVALQQATAATAQKNGFLSAISHELHTPIGCIVAHLDAEERKRNGHERRAGAKIIRWAIRSMEAQIRDLFVLSLGEEDHLEMRPQEFEVGERVDEIIESLAGTASTKNLFLRNGSKNQEIFVFADPRRIEQVLLNLVENAVKYTEKGGITVTYALEDNERLVINVIDTGIGIAKEHQDSLFQPFRRFGSIEKDRNSFGIGLAAVHTLLRHLGGTVSVMSDIGAGSTFTVKIPIVIPPEESVEADEGSLATKSVLIVDDRIEILLGLANSAASIGYNVDIAESASLAANYLAAKIYDVVLIDLEMPRKSGTDLASETRRGNGPNAKGWLVAMSAGTPESVGMNRSEYIWPFNEYLQKPVHGHEIQQVVENAQQMRRRSVEDSA
jgi:signal transduction histidine kinase/CheY-like chemotaxis protein